MNTPQSWSERTVAITGAASGIGRAAADRFAGLGARLILIDKDQVGLAQCQEELSKRGSPTQSIVLDFSNLEEAEGILSRHSGVLEQVDVLVNSAGVVKATGLAPVRAPYEVEEMINVNLIGVLLATRAVTLGMIRRNRGHIVNLGSVTGRWVSQGEVAYSGTKFGVRALSEAFRMDLFKSHIRVTTIEPGLTKTHFSDPKIYKEKNPLSPEDVAEAIVWSVGQPDHVNIQELIITSADQYILGNLVRAGDDEGKVRELDYQRRRETYRKAAVITGATSGIGLAAAEGLAAEGYELALIARRKEELEDIKCRLEDLYQTKTSIIVLDVSDYSAVQNGFKENDELLSRMQILINNAGIARGWEPFHKGSMQEWRQTLTTNLAGAFYMQQLMLPYFLKQGNGLIINVGSVAGQWTYPNDAVYCASKHALGAITEGLRREMMGKPVRVSLIRPGTVKTNFGKNRLNGKSFQPRRIESKVRHLTAEDISETISWICRQPLNVNVSEITIFSTDQASISMMNHEGASHSLD